MSIADAVKPVQEVTMTELSTAFLNGIKVVSWGAAGTEALDKIQVTLQLKNALDTPLAAKERLRLTAGLSGTMALKGAGRGTVLSGSGTADMIIETDETTGAFDLEVTDAVGETCTIVAGTTQGSGVVDCAESKDLVFAP